MSGVIGAPGFTRTASLASGASSDGYPISSPFAVQISGTWTGSWWVEQSFDGSTWANCTIGGAPASFSTNGYFVAPNVFVGGTLFRITRGTGTGTLVAVIAGGRAA